MGFLFQSGRILLGLLLVISGVIILQSGFKDHLQSFKELKRYVSGTPTVTDVIKSSVEAASETTLQNLVYCHAILIITSGALVIADVRVGGFLMTMAMIGFILTRDNPLLSVSDASWRMNFQNMLKDLAVAGAGILLFSKKKKIVHKK